MVDTQVLNNIYEKEVDLKYQLYNGLFLTLPLDAVEQTGLLLPLLEQACDQGLQLGQSPEQIIRDFFQTHRAHFTEDKQIQFLFKVIQGSLAIGWELMIAIGQSSESIPVYRLGGTQYGIVPAKNLKNPTK